MDFYPLSHSSAPRQVAAMFQTYKGPSAVQVGRVVWSIGWVSEVVAAGIAR